VKKVTGKDFPIEEVERRPGDPALLIAKSEKAKKILGWEPKYGIEEIMTHAWNWHKKLKQSNSI